MKLHPLNYLNLVFWTTVLVIPFLLQLMGVIDTEALRIHPMNGPWSIFTGVFLHGDWSHLMGNFTSIILGTSVLLNFQSRMYFTVIIAGLFLPPLFPYYFQLMPTIGISGLAYTLIWYIIFRGLMSRDVSRFIFGVVFILFYGSSAKGVTPEAPFGISWLTHLGGFLVAFNLALIQRLRSSFPTFKGLRFLRKPHL